MNKRIHFFLGDSVHKSTPYDYFKYVVSLNGCNERCAGCTHHLSESDIWLTHQRFSYLGSYQQRQWVLDYLHSNTSKSDMESFFFVCGKSVCIIVC